MSNLYPAFAHHWVETKSVVKELLTTLTLTWVRNLPQRRKGIATAQFYYQNQFILAKVSGAK